MSFNKNHDKVSILPEYEGKKFFFESIFQKIDKNLKFKYKIIAEFDLGFKYSKRQSPYISGNQGTFLFTPSLPINVAFQGNLSDVIDININYNTLSPYFNIRDVFSIKYNQPFKDSVLNSNINSLLVNSALEILDTTNVDSYIDSINNSILKPSDSILKQKLEAKKLILTNPEKLIPTREKINKKTNDLISGNDNIIQNISFGPTTMPLKNSLLSASQDLFGLRADLKFGNTHITTVAAKLNSSHNVIQTNGNEKIKKFEFTAFNYDDNKHFFLSHYFRDNFENALKDYPFISSKIIITKVEVWIINNSNNVDNNRNIVAFQDLGESQVLGLSNVPIDFITNSDEFPYNNSNQLNPETIGEANSVLTDEIRNFSTISNGITLNLEEGADYIKIENARKLKNNEFIFNEKLGYISLKKTLNAEDALAVSFEYRMNGETYMVGELVSNVKETTDNQLNTIVTKLIKSPILQIEEPSWDLMMKNIYDINGKNISEENFKLNILYGNVGAQNVIAPKNNTPLPSSIQGESFLRVLGVDNLDNNQNTIEEGDGFLIL